MPTLEDITRAHLCSDAVARGAMQLLRNQGLIVSRQGLGSFVRPRTVARRHGVDRYDRARWTSGTAILTAEAAAQGLTATQLLRELAEVPAPDRVAERLEIDPGTPVWVRRRTTLIDGRPNQLADSYYELAVAADAPRIREEDTGPGGGFSRLEEAGYLLAEICEEWAARMPTGPESVALKLPAGTPVLELIRTVLTTTGRPVEVMLAVMAGDMTSMSYRFPIPDSRLRTE